MCFCVLDVCVCALDLCVIVHVGVHACVCVRRTKSRGQNINDIVFEHNLDISVKQFALFALLKNIAFGAFIKCRSTLTPGAVYALT